MKTEQMLAIIEGTLQSILSLSESKGREYTDEHRDRLSNFKDGAADLGMQPEQILWVYASKHLASIKTHIRDIATGNDRKLSEPIDGRIDDAILYLILLKCLLIERKNDALIESTRGNERHAK